ncbi:MAG: gliding motility-associated peptidyl-prolyl isomerase GldI [Flavobacteriales bacterium CG_4_9_14_3_um_filter_40_17]|nr:MAG: gliding motility-associated peptidyl-prolyl isomerase GldI [Flavobacteriales bacterium CG_4_9_14_3_um_filter_40_17]
MKVKSFYFIVLIFIFSCHSPEARRPVSVSSGTSIKESAKTSKLIYEEDAADIKAYLSRLDSIKIYTSNSGFWFYYDNRDSIYAETPKPGDLTKLTYQIEDLNNEIIYDSLSLGVIQYTVDKEMLFKGLREGVKLMYPGQQVTFLFPSELAYSYTGDKNLIEPNEPLVCKVHLYSIEKDSIQ